MGGDVGVRYTPEPPEGTHPGPGVFCRVLGPVTVEIEGRPAALGGPQPRRLIGALLSSDGAPVPVAVLLDLLWGADHPADAAGALQVLISRLRSAVGSRGRELITRAGAGYQFAVPLDATDHGRLAALVEEGGRQLEHGDAAKAADAYESALLLWRGEPWQELGDELIVAGLRARLVELREVALEELQAARLELRESAAAVAALSEAVVYAPYRERRWELLALGLYRGGRQAQALAELQRFRKIMVDELGVEPSAALRALEQRMLVQDPSLLAAGMSTPRVASLPEPARSGHHRDRPPEAISRPLSSFVGRTEQLDLLERLLREQRLVSVVGPAGVGKTRLALEHAARAASPASATSASAASAADGEVWLARLADVRDGQSVAATLADSIGLVQLAGDPVAVMCRALAGRPGLLVLDNCEHLLDAVGELVLPLLRGCPELRVLATSRAPLRVDGEYVVPLAPLPTYREDGRDGAAVELLSHRVHQHRADWQPSPGELAAARHICTLLDGLPLALELAAARERAFGLDNIATHLRSRLDVLGTVPRGTVNPHASLQAAIAWSIDQLDVGERALVLGLWPFEGGFTWQAAQAVHPAPDPARPVLPALAMLLDRSVISTDSGPDAVRHRMLETIRKHCRELDPDPARTEEAHARWVRALVDEQTALLEGPDGPTALATLRVELPNIQAAINHDLEHAPSAALTMASRLELAWVLLGKVADGVRLTTAALAACPTARPAERAAGLLALSFARTHSGAAGEAIRLADAALELLGEPDDPVTAGLYIRALHFRGAAAMEVGDAVRARDALTRVDRALEGTTGPPWMAALIGVGEGMVRIMEGRCGDATAVLGQARRDAHDCGSLWTEGLANWLLALSLLRAGAGRSSALASLALLNQALEVFQRQGNVCDLLAVLRHSCYPLAVLGRPGVAATLLRGVTRYAARTGTDARRYAHLAGPTAEAEMGALLAAPEEASASGVASVAQASDPVALLRLFTDAVAQLQPS